MISRIKYAINKHKANLTETVSINKSKRFRITGCICMNIKSIQSDFITTLQLVKQARTQILTVKGLIFLAHRRAASEFRIHSISSAYKWGGKIWVKCHIYIFLCRNVHNLHNEMSGKNKLCKGTMAAFYKLLCNFMVFWPKYMWTLVPTYFHDCI